MDNNEKTGDGAGAPEPIVLEIAGRTFDVSTDKGRIEHKAWAEAISTLVGRQSNEVGELRKFKSAMAPADNEIELLTKVQELREQGEHGQADKLLFGFAKQTAEKSKRQLEVERANERTWRAYLKDRPELTQLFDEETIRSVSETKLDLYNVEDPYKVLDSFWMPRAKGSESKPKDDKPPVVPSGGASRVAPKTDAQPVAEGDSMADINSFLDSLPK